MKKIFSLAIAAAVLTGSAYAQSQMLDDFEAGVTGWTIQGFQGETASHLTTDGANSTTASVRLTDDGFGFFYFKNFPAAIAVGEGGVYRLTFYVKSDVDNATTNLTMRGFGAQINGTPVAVNVTPALNPPTIPNWTLVESDAFTLADGADVEVRFVAANGGVATPWHILVDEVAIEQLLFDPVTVKVRPLNTDWLGGDATITAVPAGGTGTFASVGFDIGNNGTIDFTDSDDSDGFSFEFVMPVDAEDGDTVTIRVVATDDASNEGERIVTYTLVPEAGRELLFSSDFETWDAGLPVGWSIANIDGAGAVNPSPDAVVSQETDNPFNGTSSLRINYTLNPDPYRYTLISESFPGDRTDYLVQGAIRASNTFGRLYLFASNDEVTWTNTFSGLVATSSTVWAESIGAPGGGGATYHAVATHILGAAAIGWWDDIVITAANEVLETSAHVWDLY